MTYELTFEPCGCRELSCVESCRGSVVWRCRARCRGLACRACPLSSSCRVPVEFLSNLSRLTPHAPERRVADRAFELSSLQFLLSSFSVEAVEFMSSVLSSSSLACQRCYFALSTLTLTAVGLEDPHINHQAPTKLQGQTVDKELGDQDVTP